MNVRITFHDAPHRTDLYGGMKTVYSTGDELLIWRYSLHALPDVRLPLRRIAEIAVDDAPGDWW